MKACSRGLIILLGEAFRRGGQLSRVRGVPESVEGQRTAAVSHNALFDHLTDQYGVDLDVVIDSYTTPYDQDLCDWYGDRLLMSASCFHDEVIGWLPLYQDAIARVAPIIEFYDFVFIMRIDMCFKPLFMERFAIATNMKANGVPCLALTRRILHSSACYMHGGWHRTRYNQPRVSDMMLFVPACQYKVFEHRLPLMQHDIWDLPEVRRVLTLKEAGYFVDTMHDSDPEKDWNPIYYTVNRPRTRKWHTTDHTVDPDTHDPIPRGSVVMYPDMSDVDV